MYIFYTDFNNSDIYTHTTIKRRNFMKFKRILSLALILAMVFTLAACNKGKKEPQGSEKVPDAVWKSGEIAAPGDKFTAPKVESSEGAPIIAQISKQVDPGSSFTVTGEGFKTDGFKAHLYAQSTAKNGKVYDPQFTVVDDNTVMITVDKSLPYGVYSVYLENSKGKSKAALINRPKIWWIGLTNVNAGDELSVYGENLTTENKNDAFVYIVADDGKYTPTEITYADPYKITFKIPKGLEDGKEYTVKTHSGHGGEEGFAAAEQKLKFYEKKINPFDGEMLDVTKFGVDPKSDGDDSEAIAAAVEAASYGDTLYFPEGIYRVENTVRIDKDLKISGPGKDKVTFVMGNVGKGGIFNVNASRFEIERVGFWDVRKTEFTCAFIVYRGDEADYGSPVLNVHNCRFIKHTEHDFLSGQKAIDVSSACGIVIKNNQIEGTGLGLFNKTEKVFIIGNEVAGTYYCGKFYGQTSIVLWTTSKLDSCYNNFYAKGKRDAEVGKMGYGDYTAGRMYGIQQYCKDLYIANSTAKNTGLPADNAGEQIMLENINSLYDGLVKEGSKNSITLPDNINLAVGAGTIVTIVGGKGITQWAYVKSQKGRTLTLDHDLAIAPDSTSRVFISRCMDNVAIYKNTFDCFTNYGEAATATCGIQLYANVHNLFATHNIMRNMAYGVCITSFYKYKEGQTEQQRCGIFWSHIDNNIISDVNIGVRYVVETYSGAKYGNHPEALGFGVTVKNNKISEIKDFIVKNKKTLGGAGILIGTCNYEYIGWAETAKWDGKCIYAPLIEGNEFSTCDLANVMLYKNQSGVVLIGNKVDNGELCTIDAKGNAPAVVK